MPSERISPRSWTTFVAAEGGCLIEEEDGLDGATSGMARSAGTQRRESLGDERLDKSLVVAGCRGRRDEDHRGLLTDTAEAAFVIVKHPGDVAVDVFGEAVAQGRDDTGSAPVLTVEPAEEGKGGVSCGQGRRQGGDAVKRALVARWRDRGRDGHDGLLVFRDGCALDEGEGDADEEVPSAVVEERLAFRRRGHDTARELAQFPRAAAGTLRPKRLLRPFERIESN